MRQARVEQGVGHRQGYAAVVRVNSVAIEESLMVRICFFQTRERFLERSRDFSSLGHERSVGFPKGNAP
jgi:hypothetical protein